MAEFITKQSTVILSIKCSAVRERKCRLIYYYHLCYQDIRCRATRWCL